MFPRILHNFVTALQLILFVDLLIDLFVRDRTNPILQLLHRVAEQLLVPARRLFSALGLGRSRVDWTPLFTIFALNFLEALILRFYYG